MKFIFSMALVWVSVAAQTPDWVKNQGKSIQYSAAQYLTGYGISSVSDGKTESMNTAVSNARKNLIEKIRIRIQSSVQLKSEETGDKYSSFFSSATQSTSNLEIQGLETETYYDDNEEVMHAFVFVKRDIFISHYNAIVKSLKEEVIGNIKLAKALEEKNQSALALNQYLSCYPLCRQLEEAQSILTFAKISNSLTDLQQSAATNEITINQIRESVAKLVQRPLNTIDDIAGFLVYQLQEQIEQKEKIKPQVLVIPLTYQDTKMGSSFSRYFNQVIEHTMTEVAGWDIVQLAKAPYIASGSYWEQNANIKFIINIRNVTDGKIIASAEATVSASIIATADKSMKPDNYQNALIDQKIFAAGENAGGGLTLEAWTNKETLGNLFTEGEKLKVTVRVNMPCYIRFIYHLADGKRALMYNEYFMDASKVNVAYEIPQEFECCAPFGSEVLQIFARTDKYEQVTTDNIEGYNYLKEDLKTFVVKTRGMKLAKPKTMQTETRINITTMKE